MVDTGSSKQYLSVFSNVISGLENVNILEIV